jgi:hypothetical protein
MFPYVSLEYHYSEKCLKTADFNYVCIFCNAILTLRNFTKYGLQEYIGTKLYLHDCF